MRKDQRATESTETSLIVRLIGGHQVISQMVNGQLEVMIPGAMITITDTTAMLAIFRAWVEAGVIARRVFTHGRVAPRLYPRSNQRIIGSVLISGTQPGPNISGKTPQLSPSGCGQVVIRFGRLTIVCDDRPAWQSQETGWRRACELAAAQWGKDLRQAEGKLLAKLEGLGRA